MAQAMASYVPRFKPLHERREIGGKRAIVSRREQGSSSESDQQIDSPGCPMAAVLESRQRDRRHSDPARELLRRDTDAPTQEFDFGPCDRRRFTNDQVCQEVVQLRNGGNLDLLVIVGAEPDRDVDQLHVAQAGLGVIDGSPFLPLRLAAFSAPPNLCGIRHLCP